MQGSSLRSGTPDREADRPPPRRWFAGGVVGLLSGAVALGVAQLAAGLIGAASSPMIAVGSTAIDATPEWLKNFAIRTFGTQDKRALLIGIGAMMAVAAVIVGAVSVRRPRAGVIGICVFGGIGVLASITRLANGPADAIPSFIGVAAGLVAYDRLRDAASLPPVDRRRARRGGRSRTPERSDGQSLEPRGVDRRRFLWRGVAAAGLASISGLLGQYLVRRADASASRASVRIPKPADVAPPPPAGADLRIPGLSTFITPNDSFYRIDTALFVPAVDAAGWSLRIHGMVQREIAIDFATLLKRPLIERDITLTCVSNQVGGRLIGNARWIGAPLRDLLEEAGVNPRASQIVSRSTDGFTVGTPTALAMDGRDSMLAVGMNGEPLPLEHGFPVRMIVPGLYGYVSATKWIVDIELTTFDAFDAYWVRRGWAQGAPIKTESRIDTPKASASVQAGVIPVAGVAWAQHRGVKGVEVSVDGGAWVPAELAAQDTVDTWRQWLYRWDATPGRHSLAVRATDDTGATQDASLVPPFPSGATGDHTIAVTVT